MGGAVRARRGGDEAVRDGRGSNINIILSRVVRVSISILNEPAPSVFYSRIVPWCLLPR